MKFYHIGGLEWNRTEKHRIEHDSSRPDIWLVTYVTLIFKNLRGYIGWGSALLKHKLFMFRDQLTHSKIADFNMALGCEQDVVQLDVSVKHIFGMAVS